VTVRLRERRIQALVLDIEGTTTPVAFVYDVLFPYARAHLGEYLREHVRAEEVRAAIGRLRIEWMEEANRGETPPEWPDVPVDPGGSAVAYLEWLMDRDRKSPALKSLQGAVWDRGYETGELRGVVFEDVPPAFGDWVEGGIEIAIYSSGSELAQRRLFGTTARGDLTRFISRFFDTGIGPKTSSDSYRRIAASLSLPPARIMFVSDTPSELDAARAAGFQVVLCVRPRSLDATHDAEVVPPSDECSPGAPVRDFSQIVL
jgi:enolase-phosphatase E1